MPDEYDFDHHELHDVNLYEEERREAEREAEQEKGEDYETDD